MKHLLLICTQIYMVSIHYIHLLSLLYYDEKVADRNIDKKNQNNNYLKRKKKITLLLVYIISNMTYFSTVIYIYIY
uniref:Uncharacterized protein n=1 Tax=Heterorhabditis bacteriophora TaxID=37862 RepID=A0A1I7X345_HETBA